MSKDLKSRTIGASCWAAATQFLALAIQFSISVVLARILTPDDFGLMVVAMIFIGFANILSEGGIASAVVQKTGIDDRTLSTAFWLNTAFGLTTSLLILATSPLIALFFERQELQAIVSLTAATTAIASLGMVHGAILQRNLDFRLLGIIDLIAIVIGGAIGISAAIMGSGVFALVYASIVRVVTSTLLRWILIRWVPKIHYSRSSAREIMQFGWGLLGFSSFNYWIRRADDTLIAKLLGSFELGIYSRAYNLMKEVVQQVGAVVGRVMFASLSTVQNDNDRIRAIYLRTLNIISLFTFPMCLGLSVLAEPFVLVLYGEQWIGSIPVLHVLSLVGVTQSIGTTTGVIYQVKGRTDWMFRWGVVAGIYICLAFVIGIQWGLLGLAIAYMAAVWSLTWFNFSIPGRLISMKFRDVVSAVQQNLISAILMAAAIFALDLVISPNANSIQRLGIEVPFGVIFYFCTIHFLNPIAFGELHKIMQSLRSPTPSQRQA
ncbi:MOP flippase family protein [Nitrospira sp. T9]|uniref:MOP flippase family protein n=1 Tax=unclassified Nitrospira TaxID=2652172 RepID=UPI003F9D1FED